MSSSQTDAGTWLRVAAWRLASRSMRSFNEAVKSETAGESFVFTSVSVARHMAAWFCSERATSLLYSSDPAGTFAACNRASTYSRSVGRITSRARSLKYPARSHVVPMPFASSSTSCLRLSNLPTAMANVKPRSSPSAPTTPPARFRFAPDAPCAVRGSSAAHDGNQVPSREEGLLP